MAWTQAGAGLGSYWSFIDDEMGANARDGNEQR